MSDLANAIEDHVNRILSKQKLYSSICKVLSVDDSTRTCEIEPINGDAERTGRLQASLSLTEGLYVKPAVNSYVQLTWINEITGTITQFSEIDEVDIIIGGSSFNIIDGQVTLNGGNLGGLAVPSLVADRLNLLENDVNDLKTAFTAWTPVAHDGGAALKASTATWSSAQLIETQENDINNEDILQ